MYGVDQYDQVIRAISCRQATRRWSMILFFNMIDICNINGYNLCKDKYKNREEYI